MTNRIFKASVMAAAVGAAFAFSAPASAIPGIKFSADGVAASVNAFKFNWGIEQFMLQGGNSATQNSDDFAATCVPNGDGLCVASFVTTGYFYGQGRLNTVEDSPGVEVLNATTGTGKITYEFKIPVTARYTYIYDTIGGAYTGDNITGTISNVAASIRYGADNYFKIFYNSAGDQTNQSAGTGYGTSEFVNATQSMIFEGKVNITTSGSNNVSTDDSVDPLYQKIGTAGTNSVGGTDIFSINGGGSMTIGIEQCDADDFATALAGTPCAASTTFINTNFFRSDVEALVFDVTMLPGYQALFGPTPVPGRVVTSQLPNFGTDGTNFTNDQVCDGTATAGIAPGGASFQGCDSIYRGTNSNAQFNGSFAPEPGSLALLGLGLSALGFSVRRRSRKGTAS